MHAVAPIPTVSMTWEVRVAGRILCGVVKSPDCDGTVEQATRVLAKQLKQKHGVTARDFKGPHVFIFRRVV